MERSYSLPLVQKMASDDAQLDELYQSLPLVTEHSIRIIELLPAWTNAKIRMRLKVVDLDSDPEYEALSYTWGDSAAGRVIFVNDRYTMPATDNLFNALEGLRQWSQLRILWIDRICINQLDVAERGRQVALMGQIYARAMCVDVWLGQPATWTSPLSVRCSIGLPLEWERYKRMQRNFRTVPRIISANEHEWRAVKDSLRNSGWIIGNALKNTRPEWCSRIWVAQEFILAKQVYLCAGQYRYLYSPDWLKRLDTDDSIGEMTRFKTSIESLQASNLEQSLWMEREAQSREQQERGLIGCLKILRNRNATDIRDFVYGLTGIISKQEAELLIPDYELSYQDIYAKATFASIASRRNFDILSFVRPGTSMSTSPSDPSLRSWVVDFTDQKDHADFRGHGWLIGHWKVPFLQPRLNSDCTAMTIKACAFGTVQGLSAWHNNSDYSDISSSAIDLTWNAAQQFKSSFAIGDRRPAIAQAFRGQQVDKNASCPWAVDRATAKSYIFINNSVGHLLGSEKLWSDITGVDVRNQEKQYDYHRYTEWFGSSSIVFATYDGIIGFGPASLTENDTIVQVCSRYPFVALRKQGQHWNFQGLLYIHGFMDAETIHRWKSLDAKKEETFVLR